MRGSPSDLLPDGAKARVVLFEGVDWQIYETQGGGRALVVHDDLSARWKDAGLIDEGTLDVFRLGDRQLRAISVQPGPDPVAGQRSELSDNKAEALSFALALKATRDIDVNRRKTRCMLRRSPGCCRPTA